MCVDDLYNECGDCTDKYGYDFNKDYAPTYKKLAENMGCSSGTIIQPTIILLFICIILSTFYLI
jgi:hypothetical protein